MVAHSPLHMMNHLIFQCEHVIREFNDMDVNKDECVFMSVGNGDDDNKYSVCIEYDVSGMTMIGGFDINLEPLADSILVCPGRFLIEESTYETLKIITTHQAYEIMNNGSIEHEFETHHMMSNAVH